MRSLERIAPVPDDYRAESPRVARVAYLGSPMRAQRELGWIARDLPTGLAETVQFEKGQDRF